MLLRALPECLLNIDRLGALTTTLESLFQYLNTLSAKKCFLNSSLNLPWDSFLSLDARMKDSTFLSSSPPQEAAESYEISPHPPFLQTRQLSWSSWDMHSSTFISFVTILWTHTKTFTPVLNCGAQNSTQSSSWSHTNAAYGGIIPSFDHMFMLCLMHPRTQLALLVARAHCWLTLSLLSTSTAKSLSTVSSHSSPSLDFCPLLFFSRCRICHIFC